VSAGVILPYQESVYARRANLDEVLRHLQPLYPFFVTAPLETWSPGAARNAGVAARRDYDPRGDFDPIVFNDADSICPLEQIQEAVRLAEEAPGLVFAYDLYVRKTKEGRDGQTFMNSPSMACVAISRQCFEQVGGFDETYVGWGYEDLDFAQRCNALWPLRRVSGPVYHLWHGERNADDSPSDSVPEQVAANLERWTSVVR
jgi:GT2 family glycosyltransferase